MSTPDFCARLRKQGLGSASEDEEAAPERPSPARSRSADRGVKRRMRAKQPQAVATPATRTRRR
eukprot:1822224-Alexandrium_andersonii.AAC.1